MRHPLYSQSAVLQYKWVPANYYGILLKWQTWLPGVDCVSIPVEETRVRHVVKSTVKTRKSIISGVGSLSHVQNELLWENLRVHGRCWLKWSIDSPFQMPVPPCLSIICLFSGIVPLNVYWQMVTIPIRWTCGVLVVCSLKF